MERESVRLVNSWIDGEGIHFVYELKWEDAEGRYGGMSTPHFVVSPDDLLEDYLEDHGRRV